LRGIAAAFMVMMLAALRGVDAQRSKFHYASSDGVEAAVKYFFGCGMGFEEKRVHAVGVSAVCVWIRCVV
jgi:hypothetical protein